MISIGSDHVGYDYKEEIKKYLEKIGVDYKDFGCFSNKRVNYPEIAEKVALSVSKNESEKGILICGTGVGMGISANKVKGVRAVTCSEPYSAKLSRAHNDSNILTFGARVVGLELAKMIIQNWLEEPFEGGRHSIRIGQIKEIEKKQCDNS
jgi:ribose 5-phosphate isomerase B